jgi:hypothetical protein
MPEDGMSGSELEQQQYAKGPQQLARFFRSWIQDPLAIGAVAPSGRVLAKLMVRDLVPGARVVELGAGTGTLTQAILDRGVQPAAIVEGEQQLYLRQPGYGTSYVTGKYLIEELIKERKSAPARTDSSRQRRD